MRPERIAVAIRGDRAARPGAGLREQLARRASRWRRIVAVDVHEHDPAVMPVAQRRCRSVRPSRRAADGDDHGRA